MLLVAIPKSASTSLTHTLGTLHGIRAAQVIFPRQCWPKQPRFDLLAQYHSDARQLIAEQPELFAARDRIYKQHIVPTDHNLALLDRCAPVVLLREPRAVVSAYWRADRMLDHPPRPAFKGLESEAEWHSRAEEIGLVRELDQFRERWSRVDGALVIHYEHLVADPDACVDAVEDQWRLRRSARPVRLARERYTRVNAVQRHWLRWYRSVTRRHGRAR